MIRLATWAVLVLLAAAQLLGPAGVAASDHVTFGEPEAIARLGQPVVFQTTLEAAAEPGDVEVLVRLPGERALTVLTADTIAEGGAFRAAALLEGQLPPNTPLEFQFRVRDGADVMLGPLGETLITDDRFEWRTLSGPLVDLHWYEGDETFAQRALDIGEAAVERASELLGVTETERIDFFIYTTEEAMREALDPARENVGGQAHNNIRTMFGLIEPHEINSDWVDVLVGHELTHLVFHTATDNPYHSPPTWLDEGIATYLSEGYTEAYQAQVGIAALDGSLIPLDGLADLFPTTVDRFYLGYAESVSAVDFFIQTYDEPTLWALVRSYAEGLSDEEAFRRATGAGVAEFNESWMGSLGVDVPEPAGPVPGLPGPLPPDWDPDAEPVPAPTSQPGATGAPATASPAGPDQSPGGSPGAVTATPAPAGTPPDRPEQAGGIDNFTLGVLLAAVVVVGIIVAGIFAQRSGSPRPPPG